MTLDKISEARIQEMVDVLAKAKPIVRPSQFWTELNQKNIDQLKQEGYENFKQTIARHYFTWVVGLRDAQMRFLFQHLHIWTIPFLIGKSFIDQTHSYLPGRKGLAYNLLTNMLWTYVSNINDAIRELSEPIEGNPPRVFWKKKLISQDIANSLLEFNSVMTKVANQREIHTIAELGAGYGRTAYVFLSLLPDTRYIIADIPPALYLSERYLSNQFPQKRIFRFKDFNNYSEVAEELEKAEIAFLLPHQLELLPPKSVDLFVNISSLHEMRPDQIAYYLNVIDQITSKYFYMKQWKVSTNSPDNVVIKESDYPIPTSWSQVYWRECKVQTYFFEALFKLFIDRG